MDIKTNAEKEKILNAVYMMLMSQSFVDFYENEFNDHVLGEPESMNKEDVIRNLDYLVHIS